MRDLINIPGGYQFDPETELIIWSGQILPGSEYEPVYLNSPEGPVFTGIYKKSTDTIILLSGREVENTDSKFIDI